MRKNRSLSSKNIRSSSADAFDDSSTLSPRLRLRASQVIPPLTLSKTSPQRVEIRSPRSPSPEDQKGFDSGKSVLNVQRISKIGDAGGSATQVFKVKLDGWTCCMKEVHVSSGVADELKNEIEIMRTLPTFPTSHLPQFLGYQLTNDTYQLFISLYDGCMSTVIRDRKASGLFFEVDEIIEYGTQIAGALVVLHSKNILHRDIKSLNVFYEKQDGCKYMNCVLGDFGESVVLNGPTDTCSSPAGTPLWMAPEVYNTATCGSFPSDMWSFAMLLYELMSLEVPFYEYGNTWTAHNDIMTGRQPTFGPQQQLRYMPVLPIYESLLSLEPAKRQTSAQTLFAFRNLQLDQKKISSPK